MSDKPEEAITGMYSRGMTTSDISQQVKIYGIDVSEGKISDVTTQLCIVHQIRNSCKYVVWKDRKEFCADLKEIYAAANIEMAEKALFAMDLKWGTKYKYAIQSWQNNWENLTQYFNYPLEIRTIIYTTNTIENLNRGIRKYTKTKVQFTDDNAVQKAVYLAITNIEKNEACPSKIGALSFINF